MPGQLNEVQGPILNQSGESERKARFIPSLLGTTSIAAMLVMGVSASSAAQETSADSTDAIDEIVVTGIRSALRASADIKRRANGVVDGVVAEDIGKFPDSNLAESLQRIAGVSINRQAGEGSQVTVRGFGAGFNHVTVNGRSMPTADIAVIGGDGQGLLGQASDRAFDFSTLASESVRALQVYKSGRADIASGGVGATINVETRKPLDTEGFSGTIIAKAAHDTNVDRGDDITPEITGLLSWSDDDQKFGIALFGSYSKRDAAAGAIRNAGWDIFNASDITLPSTGLVTDPNVVSGLPSDGNQIVAVARDSRYQFTEMTRERINGQAVVQFNPTDTFRITADVLFTETEASEDRTDLSNWFDRPFDQLVFDDSPVPTSVLLSEDKGGGTKDFAMQQSHSATKDKLESYGINFEYDVMDNVTIKLDAHSSKASVRPNSPNGWAVTNVGLAMPVVLNHSVDYSSGFPQINVNLDDSVRSNGDGVFDVNDVSTQVSNDSLNISQVNEIDQIDFRTEWDLDDVTTVTIGANWRKQKNVTHETKFQQVQGGWGAGNVGDVETLAPGVLEMFDWDTAFNDFDIPSGLVGVRGDAIAIFAAANPFYEAQGNPLNITGQADDSTEEEVLSVFAQFDTEIEFADRPVRISGGLRYEQTDVTSFSNSAAPSSIIWTNDNDFRVATVGSSEGFAVEASYHNFLPNIDIAVDMTDDFVTRFSYSKSLARTGYDNLKGSFSLTQPAGPTFLGNTPTASTGNPALLPLVSENFDVSFEWYYGDDDFITVGAFHKNVKNFVGNATFNEPLFGVRDVTSGADGTRSGQAVAAIQSLGVDVTNTTLFTMTALIDTLGNVADATAEFAANVVDGQLDPAYQQQSEALYDIEPNGSDPLMEFTVSRPVNSESAAVRGLEISAQHFFGDSGFGIAGSYTLVDSDVAFDVLGDPTASQFALEGLSDTANVTLIYEKGKISARAAYNWRDSFLNESNRGDTGNNPTFTEAFASIDANISYSVTDNITVSLEAINITGENTRQYNRSVNQLWFARENAPRFFLGVRYGF